MCGLIIHINELALIIFDDTETFMNIEFKPRIEYINWCVLIIFLILFTLFGKLILINVIGILVLYSLIVFDLISRSNSILLNEKEIVIKRNIFGISKEIKIISVKDIKQITLLNPYRIRGIRILFNDKSLKSFRSNIRKRDLIQFGENLKIMTTAKVMMEGYFKTKEL